MYQKTEMPEKGTYHMVVDPFDVDFTGRLTIGQLGNHLLNAAGFHANERGFGIERLNEDDNTWVLSRVAMEFTELPREYRHFTVETWIENVMRLFTARNFCIRDQFGNPIGYARTIWAMINRQSRKPVDLFSINDGRLGEWALKDEQCPIEGPTKIKVSVDEPVDVVKVKYSDIDINGHMNSCRYIEHVLDLFSINYLKEHNVKRFEIAYMAECLCGEQLALFKEETEPGVFQIEIRKIGTNEISCRSKVIFN
ncbi:MAG: acyl-[acyl-carrier-protein] thioesterase [Bacteroidaceae bacterium]|nr:acyl-[acyl-carrier-protein] thioesterase [Bacteroidaceae bacterium]